MGVRNIYTIVTNDKYEFPVKSDLRANDVAEFLSVSTNYVSRLATYPTKKSKYKVVLAGRVKFNQSLYNKKYAMMHDRSDYYKERYRRLKNHEIK